jgi:hypothetical protein
MYQAVAGFTAHGHRAVGSAVGRAAHGVTHIRTDHVSRTDPALHP